MFPSDDVLIARGKYSTRSKERREQLKRVQGICTTVVTTAHTFMRDCEERPPSNSGSLQTLEVCLKNMADARLRLISLSDELAALEPEAWGSEVETT